MRATSLILKIFGLTVITMSTLACGASSSGKEQPAAAQPAPAAQGIAVVNTATWCPTCQENGDRAMQALTAASVDGAVSLVVNDLSDDATAAKSAAQLQTMGLTQAIAARTSTGVVYFFHATSKRALGEIPVARTDDELKTAVAKAKAAAAG